MSYRQLIHLSFQLKHIYLHKNAGVLIYEITVPSVYNKAHLSVLLKSSEFNVFLLDDVWILAILWDIKILFDISDGCPYPNSHRRGITCYQYQSGGLGWQAAEDRSVRLGGHLASVRNTDEQAYLSDLMLQYSAQIIWVGGKISTGKHWTYSASRCIWLNMRR